MTDAGVLCHGGGGFVGFWSRAASAFVYWQTKPDGALQPVDDDLVFSAAARTPPTLYGLTANGLWKVFEADPLPEASGPILGAARLPEGGVRIVAGRQVFHVGEGGGRPEPVGTLGGAAAGEAQKALFALGCVLVCSTRQSPRVVHVDMRTGAVDFGRFPVRPPWLLDRLWRQAMAGDRDGVRRLLRAVDRLPDLASPWDLNDVVLDGNEPVGLVGERGAHHLVEGETAPAPGPRPVLEARIDRTSWLLWLEPETHLPAAIDEYLARSHPQSLPLLEGLWAEAGARLPELVLERARGRSPVFDECCGRELFERSGGQAMGVVLGGLADPDPAVLLLATQGASASGLRKPLAVEGARLDSGLRRAFASPVGNLHVAALEAVRAFGRRGFSESVCAALEEGERPVRVRAAEVAGGFPDPSERLLASLRRASSEDPDPRTREQAVEALATHGSVTSGMAVVLACADIHLRVRERASACLAQLSAGMPSVVLLEAVDLCLLLLMARRESLGRGRGWACGESVELLPGQVCGALCGSPSGEPGREPGAALLEAAIDLVLRDKDHALRGDRDPKARIAKLLPTLRSSLVAGQPRILLAVMAETLREESPVIADRLALLSVFASEEVPAARPASRGSLVERLRALSPRSPCEGCLARTRALADGSGLVGLAAAYALAARDEASRAGFERRCRGPESDRLPILAACLSVLMSEKDATAFSETLAVCRRVRAHRRQDAVEGVREVLQLGVMFLPVPIRQALLREVASDASLPQPYRNEATRELEALSEQTTESQ